jgi:hypothetical protein
MPSTVTSLGGGVTVTGGALTLAAANVVTGNVSLSGGAIAAGSTLKVNNGAHTISTTTSTTIPTLDISSVATGGTIVFSPSAGTTLSITNITTSAGGTVTLTCTGGTGSAASVVNPATVTSYTCIVPPAGGGGVSAPIFSTKEKAAVFGQEVK